jgi:hypothetical protein
LNGTINPPEEADVADELKVDLDHLIQRESLRFVQPTGQTGDPQYQQSPKLRLYDLGDPFRTQLFRKPDFQRATAAWTPEQCLSLLESIVDNQVVPSLIMWASPNNTLHYILDGGHRISVVMAWLFDDWGDKRAPNEYGSHEEEQRIRRAATVVRDLVNTRIGTIQEYQAAGEEIIRLTNEGKAPRQEMEDRRFERGSFYNRFRSGGVAFDILWVTGNYDRAERSFASINRSGTKLSEWELKLIDNRNSSFIRAVMALANNASAEHYWLGDVPDGSDKPQMQQQARAIVQGIHELHDTLFTPPFRRPPRELRQPWFVIQKREQRPPYIAELLVVADGGKGQDGEIAAAIDRDKSAPPAAIIANGTRLIDRVRATFEHITGPSPRSMALVPALYLYSDTPTYVRSLFYGLLYWIVNGSEEEILQRKRIFCAYRSSFEQVLEAGKADFINTISRGTGSGPEVTVPTARYYQGLLTALIAHKGDMAAPGFAEAYNAILKGPNGSRTRATATSSGRSRSFTPNMKSRLVLHQIMRLAPRCGICGGLIDPQSNVQHDHVVEYAKGGTTTPDNQRLTHPFCNNNRPAIEAIRNGQGALILPPLVEPELETGVQQLRLFDDFFQN